MTDDRELDIRDLPRPQRHPIIFAAFEELGVGEALLLVNDHEPQHLREQFERERPGGFTWESLGASDDGSWRVRIGRTARTTLPHIVGDSSELPALGGGSAWRLEPSERDLDANIIDLSAGDEIAAHDGPDLDVLIHVLAGTGTLETEDGDIPLDPGKIVWLPPRSRRRFVAGPEGLRYFSVHKRKPGLTITAAPPRP